MGRKERRRKERLMQRENTEAQRRAEMIIAREKVKNAKVAKIEQNGITIADLEMEYEKGYSAGFNTAAEPMYRTMMAAICLALQEKHGFGKKRIKEVLAAVDEKVLYSLSSTELVDEVFDRIGLQLLFSEPFDRIQEKE